MATHTIISLFSGAGMLDAAVRCAIPSARTIIYVERETPAAAILAARMADGSLCEAPIWSDIGTFDGRPFNGRVDGIIGGFPCTDLSVAGRQAGLGGDASGLFFEYVRIIREVQPRWVFIENVPPVLAFPTGGTVLGELAALGFDAEWGTVRASDVGAPHRRDRAFILAYDHRRRRGERTDEAERQQAGRNGARIAPGGDGQLAYCPIEQTASLPDPATGGVEQALLGANGEARAGERDRPDSGFDTMADADDAEFKARHKQPGTRGEEWACYRGAELADAGLQHVELQQRQVRNESTGSIDELAHATQRGLGELREPSGRSGLADGCDAAVGYAELPGRPQPVNAGFAEDAAEAGAGLDHRPERAGGMVDHPASPRCGWRKPGEGGPVRDEARRGEPCGRCDAMENPRCPQRRAHDERGGCGCERCDGQREAAGGARESGAVYGMANAEITGLQERGGGSGHDAPIAGSERDCLPLFPPGPVDTDAWQRILANFPDLAPAVESGVRGLADVSASRVDRLRAGGNGVVVLQGSFAFSVLARRAGLNF